MAALTATNHLLPSVFPSSSPAAAVAAAAVGMAPASPSPTSSPSHDFTFTIPLDPPPPPLPSSSSSPLPSPRAAAASRPQGGGAGGDSKGGGGATIDLAPADDIFFHGHLLPLRILTRPPLSARRSTENHKQLRPASSSSNTPTIAASVVQRNGSTSSTATDRSVDDVTRGGKDAKAKSTVKGKSKSKNFALSLFAGFWRKDTHSPNGKAHDWPDGEGDQDRDDDDPAAAKRKRRHYLDDVGRALRKYATAAMDALLSTRGGNSNADERRRAGQRDLRRQAHSFSSGYLSSKKTRERGERPAGSSVSLSFKRRKSHWGDLASAPASMRTSPNNSGLLVPGGPKASAESTMEELQSAIQAAIAHCKSSIAVKDKDNANDTAANNHSNSNGNSEHTCKCS